MRERPARVIHEAVAAVADTCDPRTTPCETSLHVSSSHTDTHTKHWQQQRRKKNQEEMKESEKGGRKGCRAKSYLRCPRFSIEDLPLGRHESVATNVNSYEYPAADKNVLRGGNVLWDGGVSVKVARFAAMESPLFGSEPEVPLFFTFFSLDGIFSFRFPFCFSISTKEQEGVTQDV